MSKPSSTPKPANGGPSKSPTPGRSASGPKFYNGPTVTGKSEDVKRKVSAVARSAAKDVKKTSRKAAATVRRHPWSFFSIITTIPFLILISLFSTIVCPPPTTRPSSISRLVLTPLGLHTQPPSTLHETLCYPANVYHREVLTPYVYPVIDNLEIKARSHPIYKSGVAPALTQIQVYSQRAWKGPIRPIVNRISRGARRFYLTFIEPRVPYVKARLDALTAPYTSRISSFNAQNVSPRIKQAQVYSKVTQKRVIDTYSNVAKHPITRRAIQQTNGGFQLSKRKAYDGYVWARPRAIAAGLEAHRITADIVGPRVVKAVSWTASRVDEQWQIIRAQISHLYYTHLDPYTGPYVAKINQVISPLITSLYQRIYLPYIKPVIVSFIPAELMIPEKPKSFWAMMADILPSPGGGHAAEHRGQMDGYYAKMEKEKAQTRTTASRSTSSQSTASKSVSTASGETEGKQKIDRAEIDKAREALKGRIEAQGQAGYDKLHKQILDHHVAILSDSDKFQTLANNARSEIDYEIDYVLKGLDKLYTSSPTLTTDQVKESSQQADARVSKTLQAIKDRLEKKKGSWHDQGAKPVREASNSFAAFAQAELRKLSDKIEYMGNANSNDWAKYKALQPSIDSWKDKYSALHSGETKDKLLNAPNANVNAAFSGFRTELDDIFQGFRARLGILRRSALDRIDAREALASSSSSSTSSTASIKAKAKAPDGSDRVSILPIEEVAEAAAAGAAYIGKGKEQVISALSQANEAAQTPVSSASSLASEATEAVKQATESAKSVAGISTSPEGAAEHIQSVASAVSEGYDSATKAAGEQIHQATRSAMKAVGVSPTPEGVQEHAESIASQISSNMGDAAAAASLSASSLYTAASTVIDSIGSQASETIHSATRAAAKAVGATPSPEGVMEHAESIQARAEEMLESAGSIVSGAASTATEQAKKVINRDEL